MHTEGNRTSVSKAEGLNQHHFSFRISKAMQGILKFLPGPQIRIGLFFHIIVKRVESKMDEKNFLKEKALLFCICKCQTTTLHTCNTLLYREALAEAIIINKRERR